MAWIECNERKNAEEAIYESAEWSKSSRGRDRAFKTNNERLNESAEAFQTTIERTNAREKSSKAGW